MECHFYNSMPRLLPLSFHFSEKKLMKNMSRVTNRSFFPDLGFLVDFDGATAVLEDTSKSSSAELKIIILTLCDR